MLSPLRLSHSRSMPITAGVPNSQNHPLGRSFLGLRRAAVAHRQKHQVRKTTHEAQALDQIRGFDPLGHYARAEGWVPLNTRSSLFFRLPIRDTLCARSF